MRVAPCLPHREFTPFSPTLRDGERRFTDLDGDDEASSLCQTSNVSAHEQVNGRLPVPSAAIVGRDRFVDSVVGDRAGQPDGDVDGYRGRWEDPAGGRGGSSAR